MTSRVYAALFAHCEDAVVIANTQGQVVFANARADQLFGDTLVSLLLSPGTSSLHLLRVDAATERRSSELPLRKALDGERFSDREYILTASLAATDTWLSISGCPVSLPGSGQSGGMVIIRDITVRKLMAQHKQRAEMRDPLTGLVNRTVLMDRVSHALTRTLRQDTLLVALLCLDIQRLKTINDAFGYAVGDHLLTAFAERLQQVLKLEDTVARLGGDEFVVLLEEVHSYSEVIAIAETLIKTVTQPFAIDGLELPLEIRMGIAFGNGLLQDPEVLLRYADLALSQAKRDQGDPYCVYEDSLQQTEINNTLYLEVALRNALDNHEFLLHYQPIFNIKTRDIIGFESLVRWHHPVKGLISPGAFIPLAERTGLIIPLGWWVMQASCQQLRAWHESIPDAEALFMSVNVSSKQFAQPDFVDRVKQVIATTGRHPARLRMEITESVLIDHSASIIEKLEALQAMGIKLAIDDFGTGYSSLSYLHRFPFDIIKLDRSFLDNADADYEKLEILQSVVRLAWNLGLEVVAEGIETDQHYARIKALRCESGQGFLFSRPLPITAATDLLRHQQPQIPD